MADLRERLYAKWQMSDCYMFRVDGDSIIDATVSGNRSLHPASCVLHPASCTLHPLWTVQRLGRGRAARSRGRGRGAQVDKEEDLATYVPRAQLQASADALNREVRPRAREAPRLPRAFCDALTRAAVPT